MDDRRLSRPTSAIFFTRWGSAVLAATLFAACARRPVVPPPPPPPPVHDAALHARVLAAADTRRRDVALLDSALSAPHPRLRAAAALAIGQLKVRALGDQLLAAARDSDTTVARNAAFALGLMRDTARVGALRLLADSAMLPVAIEALWSLGEIGGAARSEIESAIADTAPRPPAWRREALLASAKLTPVPVGVILRHLADPDTQVVWAAAYAIARQRAPSGLRALAEIASSPSSEVRALVARALARPAVGDSLAALATSTLARLANDTAPHVRVNVARSAATLGQADLVARLTTDGDANVRIAAAQSAVAPVAGPLPRLYFERIYGADTSWMFRKSIMESAFRAGIRLAVATAWLRSSDWRQRAAVAEAMGGSRSPTTLEDLDNLTRDPDGRVRAATFRALGEFADSGDASPRVRTMLLVALRDPDLFARAAAIDALGGRPVASEVPFVLASYRLSAADRDKDARLAAIRFFAAAWRRDSAAFTRGMIENIRALPAPADPAERRVANGFSLLSGWGGASPAGEAASWYEEVVQQLVVADSQPVAEIVTERGTIVVSLLGRDAPLTVQNFVTLARRGFYDGLRFHRVVPNFVVQDGDPRGDGNGGPGYQIRDELNPVRYDRGVVGMALSGPDTGGSQYFITHSAQPHLDGHYTAFGRVVSGFDVLDRIVQGDQIRRIRVR